VHGVEARALIATLGARDTSIPVHRDDLVPGTFRRGPKLALLVVRRLLVRRDPEIDRRAHVAPLTVGKGEFRWVLRRNRQPDFEGGFWYAVDQPTPRRTAVMVPNRPIGPATVFGMIRDALMAIFIAVTAVAAAELVVWAWTL
jgi:hypothetical protein